MTSFTLTTKEAGALAVLAGFGFLVPNGVFIYYLLADRISVQAALSNPVSLVFIMEAFFLMFLFAWLIRKAGLRRPTGFAFILMSLVGSLAFSVPATLYLALRDPGRKPAG